MSHRRGRSPARLNSGVRCHQVSSRAKSVLIATLTVAAALLFFPVRFALAFELLGNPVHSPTAGWLGPTPRDS